MKLYILTLVLFAHKILAKSPCKNMLFKVRKNGQALQGFVFKTFQVRKEGDCRANCYMQAQRCLSYNFISTTCELNESDDVMHPENLIKKVGSVYSPAENTCKCSKNELCRFDFARNIHHCECNFYDPKASCSPSSSTSPSPRLLTTTGTTNLLMTSLPIHTTSTLQPSTKSLFTTDDADDDGTNLLVTSPPTPTLSSTFLPSTTTSLLTTDDADDDGTNLLVTSPPTPTFSSTFLPSRTTRLLTTGDNADLLLTSAPNPTPSTSLLLPPILTVRTTSTFQAALTSSISPTTAPSASCTDCELNFPRASKSDYVLINKGLAKELRKFTISFWLKVSTSYDKTTMIFSYKKDGSNSLSLAIKDDGVVEVKLNGGGDSLNSDLTRGKWIYFCITWDSHKGDVKLYQNGVGKDGKTGMQKGAKVKKDGKMYFGQKYIDDGFDESMVIYGSIADFHIWDEVLDISEVKAIYNANCGQTSSVHGKGDALSWETVTNAEFEGSVKKISPSTCNSPTS